MAPKIFPGYFFFSLFRGWQAEVMRLFLNMNIDKHNIAGSDIQNHHRLTEISKMYIDTSKKIVLNYWGNLKLLKKLFSKVVLSILIEILF